MTTFKVFTLSILLITSAAIVCMEQAATTKKLPAAYDIMISTAHSFRGKCVECDMMPIGTLIAVNSAFLPLNSLLTSKNGRLDISTKSAIFHFELIKNPDLPGETVTEQLSDVQKKMRLEHDQTRLQNRESNRQKFLTEEAKTRN